MIDIKNIGKPINELDIARVEGKLKMQLPDVYRRFLLINNGGIPSPDVVDIDDLPGSPTDVQVFFGIDRDIVSSNLLWNYQLFSERLPNSNCIPIACDSGGNLFCVCLSGFKAGSIVYCSLDNPELILYPVAEDFEAFLGKLREWE